MAFVHRLLHQDERLLLREGWQTLESFIGEYGDEQRRRRYFHLYKQKRSSDIFREEIHQRFASFSAQLRQELADAALIESNDELTHYGYLVSFPGAPAQDWHVDYDGDLIAVYIPISRETEKNATQYLQKNDGYCMSVQFINRSDDQIPIIYNERRSVHRGIENSEWFTRVLFYCYFANPAWKNSAPLFESATRLAVNVDAEPRYRPEESAKLDATKP